MLVTSTLFTTSVYARAFTSKELGEMLSVVNRYRTQSGLKALCLNSKLNRIAQKHSDDQARQRKMAHDLPGSSFSSRTRSSGFNGMGFAENVAMNYGINVEATNAQWWNSPGHKANILGSYTHIGIAVGGDGPYYYTQVFGSSNSESCENADTSYTTSENSNTAATAADADAKDSNDSKSSQRNFLNVLLFNRNAGNYGSGSPPTRDTSSAGKPPCNKSNSSEAAPPGNPSSSSNKDKGNQPEQTTPKDDDKNSSNGDKEDKSDSKGSDKKDSQNEEGTPKSQSKKCKSKQRRHY
jgi:hypothetical protein